MLVLIENGRIPIENPNGSIEVSMIEEGRVSEFSGRHYALLRGGSWMKLFLLSSIWMNVFVVPWGVGNATSVIRSADLPHGLSAPSPSSPVSRSSWKPAFS